MEMTTDLSTGRQDHVPSPRRFPCPLNNLQSEKTPEARYSLDGEV
jgi:hypothetical protein